MSKKIFTLIALGAALNALAQKEKSKETTLDEVVVTATKFPTKTSATGKVINVITKQQLEQSGGKDLAQILTEQTGMYIAGANSNAGKDKSIFMRGAGVAYTLITIDGVPVYDASGIGANFDIRNISVSLIERIEILKGSQSTLYGSDAMAGVINIITKRNGSNSKPFDANASVAYGTYNTILGNVGVNGKKGILDYAAGYSYTKTDGISEAASTAANADKDGYKQEAFNANFGIAATNKFSIKPFLRYSWVKGDIDNGAFTDGLNNTFTNKSFNAGVKNEIGFGKTKLNVIYSYNKIERGLTEDSRKGENGYNYFVNQGYNAQEHFVDAYAGIELCKTVKLTAGADFRTSNTSQLYSYKDDFSVYESKLGSDSAKQNQVGIYAALNISNNKDFNIELGGRYNNHSVYGGNGVFNINPSYQITDDIKVFANVSSGYRTPSLYQLYSEYGNKSLKPEVSLNSEIGLQHYFLDKKVKTQVVLFTRNINDVIYFYTNTATFQSQYINQDKQKDFGIEFEASAQITKGTTLNAHYAFVDGRINTKLGGVKDTSYNNLLRRPKHSFGIGISSKITDRLFVSINANSVGKRQDMFFNNTTFKTESATLDSYVLVDAYAEYAFPKQGIKIFVNGKNLTNANYTEISGYNTLGLNVYGGIRWNLK